MSHLEGRTTVLAGPLPANLYGLVSVTDWPRHQVPGHNPIGDDCGSRECPDLARSRRRNPSHSRRKGIAPDTPA